MASKPETRLVKKIMDYVTESGGYVLKLHGSAMQRAGEPDLIGSIPRGIGLFTYYVHFAVEVKVGNNQPSELQLHRLEQWNKQEFVTGVVWSLEEFKGLVG